MSKLNTYESIAIEWLQENIASVLEDDPDVGIFANPELADIFRQCISFIEDQETIQSLQEENERLKQETKPFPMLAGIPITQTTAELIFEMYSALYGNDQSLEKIKSRGGFGWCEVKHITDNFIKRFGRQRYELLIKDK